MNWEEYRYFLQVVKSGTLSAAAQTLDVNQSTVFRKIDSLEARVKMRLFERHRTGYLLTAAGQSIVEMVESIEATFTDTERALLGKDVSLAGTIRLSTSDTIGYFWLPRLIGGFKQQYPDIKLDIEVSTQFRSLPRHEVDIVLSASNKQPETMVGKCLVPIIFNLYASKDYIKQHNGTEIGVDDLAAHAVLMPSQTLAHLSITQWLSTKISEKNIAIECDKFTSLYYYCKQGLGVAPLPAHVAKGESELIKLATTPVECNSNIWMLTHPDSRQNARIRAFMDYIKAFG